MSSPKEFTVVIQGGLHRHSLDGVLNYKKYGHVIVSGWHQNKSTMLTHAGIRESNLVLVPEIYDKSVKNFYNPKNIYRQIISTLNGLYLVKTPYVIKARSDESFSNIVPFQNMVKSSNKIVCSNIYFRQDKIYKFHMSDHLIGCRTDEMIAAFELAKYRCEKHKYFFERHIEYYTDDPKLATDEEQKRMLAGAPSKPITKGHLPPEVILCTSFLMNRGIKIDKNKSRDLMIANFNICRTEWLGKCRYKDGKYKRPENQIPQINYMSQI